jgi:hypothetical protein
MDLIKLYQELWWTTFNQWGAAFDCEDYPPSEKEKPCAEKDRLWKELQKLEGQVKDKKSECDRMKD